MSFPSAPDITEFFGLAAWLLDGKWRTQFETCDKLADSGLIPATIKISDGNGHAGRPCAMMISAKVTESGRKNHFPNLFIDYHHDTKTRKQSLRPTAVCTCQTAANCRHAGATLEALARIVGGSPVNPRAESPRNLKAAPTALSLGTTAWLHLIRDAAVDTTAHKKPAAPYTRFLAYCIESRPTSFTSATEKLHLTLRTGNHTKSGITIDSNATKADPSRPTKAMTSEDLLICSHFHNRARKVSAWGSSMELEGGMWEEILIPALATGRLFFGRHSRQYHKSTDHHALTEGPPVPVETTWEIHANGSAQPILKLPSPELIPILTHPARYLDPVNHQLGLLQSHLRAELLEAWADGPVVPPEDIGLLSHELATVSTESPLPIPDEKPAETLAGLTPVPRLHITEVMVGPFLKRHIGGQLTFSYAECPPVFPLNESAPPTTTWLDGNRRINLERDRDAETALAAILTESGLTPLHEILPAQDLTDKNRHSVVLRGTRDSAADWLEFIEGPVIGALENQGWIIETNPKLGLTVHEVADFFPTIESDPKGEIDWFRFDVTGDFDGRRVSLIPHIARAIRDDWHLRYQNTPELPESILIPCDKPEDGHIRFPARRFLEMLEQVRHLFQGMPLGDGPIRIDRLGAAGLADSLTIDNTETNRSLAALGECLRDIHGLPEVELPATVLAELRPYQMDGFRWLQFLARHGLHGILADDMGLGKTVQTLAHLTAQHAKSPGNPSLVVAPTSVVPNWAAETEKFAPHLKTLVLHGGDRANSYGEIPNADIVFTSFPLLSRDADILAFQHWHIIVLDEAQVIKNPRALTAKCACRLKSDQRICLSGTPMENHLGELWSLMRFLMPGYLSDEKSFNTHIRKPIERDHMEGAQQSLNRRISPLILRRTKDQVATELPEKTTLIHRIDLTPQQTDLYESLRAAMDDRVRDAISSKGLAKSHIIVLDALLKLRQICCHPQLLSSEAAQRVTESAKLEFLTADLLPTLIEEGRRILLFSQFTSMLDLIEEHLKLEKIPYLMLTGQTKERAKLVRDFQNGTAPVFLISLKAGGTGLNLTAADTIIHYDPWWNPAAENQATDRAHRIGQTKPVFVHKLVCKGTIEERILQLQERKAALVKALLSEETTKLKIDSETLSHLLSPLTPNP